MNTSALAMTDASLTDLSTAELAEIEGGVWRYVVKYGQKVWKWVKECGAELIVCFDSGFTAT